MEHGTPAAFACKDWDWRPLARLVIWTLLAAAWTRWRHALSLDLLLRVVREVVLGWLLSFGLLTYVQALIATGALRLALALDDTVYAFADRIVRPALGRVPFAATFVAAFGAELAFVLGAAYLCSAAHLWPRFLALIMEVAR